MNWTVIGHHKNKEYFEQVIKSGQLSHAYLFSGPEMIGKKMFGHELFWLINGRKFQNDPDFKYISPHIAENETKIYIEDIRALKSFLSLKPYLGPYKIIIIDDADRLTLEAANALLKILEEPPSFSLLFLISSMPQSLPDTIVSRCQILRFLPLTSGEVTEFLKQKKLRKSDKEFLIKITAGRLGLIEELLCSQNLAGVQQSVDDLRKLLNQGIFERMQYAKKIYNDGKGDYKKKVGYWLDWLHASMKDSVRAKEITKNLLSLHQVLSQPQFNHRLALENFLINL